MLIDSHSHIDLFDDPIAMARTYSNAQAACVMVTMLPSHYQVALPHIESFHNTILPALGLHPLRLTEGAQEIEQFKALARSAKYIGEIGLDFSRKGKPTRNLQLDVLKIILPSISSGAFVSVHSRDAYEEVSLLLDELKIGPVCFHYFTGGPSVALNLTNKGHYFSINQQMLKGKHREIIDAVPKDKILVESDGPFLTKNPLSSVSSVYEMIADAWSLSLPEVDIQIEKNFLACRTEHVSVIELGM